MVGALATCPLEVVKTRLQGTFNKESLMNSEHRFGTRTFGALHGLYREGGVRALYRGLWPHLVGVIPARAIYFGVFSWSKTRLSKELNMNPNGMLLNWLCGVCAGVMTITATNPIWVVKTRMQLQTTTTRYSNSFDCAVKMLREAGPRAFFTGMSASYVGISESSIQFMLYEKLKSTIKESRRRQGHRWPDVMNPFETLAISSFAKLVASALTYPHEVVRTRLREESAKRMYKGLWHCFVVIGKNEGVRGLYGGLAPHLMRVVPNAAIMFLTYEAIITWFTNNQTPESTNSHSTAANNKRLQIQKS